MESVPAERAIVRRLYRPGEVFSCSDERIPGSDDLADSLPNLVGRLAMLSPPPTPQLNLGGQDDPDWIRFMPRNPQHPVWQQRPRVETWTDHAA